MTPSHLHGESFRLDFYYGSRFSKTRDAIFLNSSKHCLTNYIEILNMFSPLIPPPLSFFERKNWCKMGVGQLKAKTVAIYNEIALIMIGVREMREKRGVVIKSIEREINKCSNFQGKKNLYETIWSWSSWDGAER